MVPGLLPRDVPGFTGRDEEMARITRLAQGGSAAVAAIGGTTGIGKTAVAVHAAHKLLPKFPDGHLFADLRGFAEAQKPAEPGEVLDMFLRRLGVPPDDLPDDLPGDLEERSGLLRQLLASRRVLMVLDNVATEAQVRPLLPGAGGSLVLITSQVTLASLELDEYIDLDVLPPHRATELLEKLIGQQRAIAEPEAVQQVQERCGRLPLALQIAGRLLAVHPAWRVKHLATMLADERHRLDRLAVGDRQVRAPFMISYSQLAESDARMFRLLGLHPSPDFDTEAAASIAGIEPDAAELVLDRLALVHLIAEVGEGRFRMHDLLRLFARELCEAKDDEETRDTALERMSGHYLETAQFIAACVDPRLRPSLEEVAGRQEASLPTSGQALDLFESAERNLLTVLDLAVERNWREKIWQLSESMEGPLRRLRHLDDLLAVGKAGLAAASAAGDKAAEAEFLFNLGGAYLLRRRFGEAIACEQNALVIFREIGDRQHEGVTLTNLGEVYRHQRRFEEAVANHQDALAIFREIGDQHGEGQALANLGVAYSELQRFEEAIACYEQDLAISKDTGDRHSEGETLSNLAGVYRILGRFGEAFACVQNALAMFQETGDRHSEGMALLNLGTIYRLQRRLKHASTCHQEALVIFRETGDQHEQGNTLTSLGNVYGDRRRFKQAITCQQEALVIFREIGDRHGEGLCLQNLGVAFADLRRYEQAITCYQDALVIFRETNDRHHEGETLANLGTAHAKLRRFEQAVSYWQAATEAFREVGDDDTAERFDRAVKVHARRLRGDGRA